jgi:hypothetical protein
MKSVVLLMDGGQAGQVVEKIERGGVDFVDNSVVRSLRAP